MNALSLVFSTDATKASNIGRSEFAAVAVNFLEKALDIHAADWFFDLTKVNSLKSATLSE